MYTIQYTAADDINMSIWRDPESEKREGRKEMQLVQRANFMLNAVNNKTSV